MTGLLASVTTVREAQLALDGGADIIDLKEPANGALGAVPPEVQRAVTRLIASRLPVSATIGDVPMVAEAILHAIDLTATSKVNLIKVGLSRLDQHSSCLRALADASFNGHNIIGVLFAEQRPPLQLLNELAQAGCYGVMLDTAKKRTGNLRKHLEHGYLVEFVHRSRKLGLLVGLAGSLTTDDIPPLLQLAPDYLGFRGALCNGGTRTAALSAGALARVRKQIPYNNRRADVVHGNSAPALEFMP